MPDRQVIVFRSRLRPGVEDAYNPHAEAVYQRAVGMPGYISAKDYSADDGERLSVIEWDSPETLKAWRDESDHAAAQDKGRTTYYSEYRIQVCSELRSSSFDGSARTSTNSDPAELRRIALAWLAAFENRDLDALLALYTKDAVHTSPKIRVRHPETGGVLRGKVAMRGWWQDSFDRLPSMKYVPTAITADKDRVFMEYVREVAGEEPYPVAEVLEIRDGKIVASRVFHG